MKIKISNMSIQEVAKLFTKLKQKGYTLQEIAKIVEL